MVDGTRAELPLKEEPEDNQPARAPHPALHPADGEGGHGSHAAPAPSYGDLAQSLSFAPETPAPEAAPAPELAAEPQLVVVVPDPEPQPVARPPLEPVPEDLSASRPENWASYRPSTPAASEAAPPLLRIPKVDLPKVAVPKISLPKVAVPKVHVPKVHAPHLRHSPAETEPAAVAPAHAAPPDDLPGYVEYRPSGLPRFVFAALFVGTAIGAVLSILAAVNDGTHWAIGMAACVTGLSLGFWWGLIAWSPIVVTISDGVLEVTEGSNTEAVDLKNPSIEVVIGDNPRSRRWRTVVTRPDTSQLVIRRSEVDAEEFTALATHWREVAERERQSVHDRRNR